MVAGFRVKVSWLGFHSTGTQGCWVVQTSPPTMPQSTDSMTMIWLRQWVLRAARLRCSALRISVLGCWDSMETPKSWTTSFAHSPYMTEVCLVLLEEVPTPLSYWTGVSSLVVMGVWVWIFVVDPFMLFRYS